jgi:hypothetical protein
MTPTGKKTWNLQEKKLIKEVGNDLFYTLKVSVKTNQHSKSTEVKISW